MTTYAFTADSIGTDYPNYGGWFIQPYRAAFRYGYWRGDSRTSGGNRHDAIVTPPAH